MKDVEARQVILNPVVTEKGTFLQEKNNQYLFRVDPRRNKVEVRQAVEKLFNVKVVGVRMMCIRGKERRIGRQSGFRPGWKKAIVTIKAGEKIELK